MIVIDFFFVRKLIGINYQNLMINYCTYDNFLRFRIFFTFVLLFVQKLEWTEVVYGPFVYGQLMVGQVTGVNVPLIQY